MKSNENKSNNIKIILRIVFLLIAVGIFFKTCGSEYAPSFLQGGKFSQKNWDKVMVGKWKYEHIEKYRIKDYMWEIVGNVEYLENGEFTKYLTKSYRPMHFGDEGSRAVWRAGGSVQGIWIVNDSFLVEDIEDCGIDIKVNRRNIIYENGIARASIFDDSKTEYKPCDHDYEEGQTFKYGAHKTETRIFELEKFSKNKIIFKGRDFSDMGEITITFKRIDN